MNALNDLADVLPLPEEIISRVPPWSCVFTSEKWDHLVCWSNPSERAIALNGGECTNEATEIDACTVSVVRHVCCYGGS